jgi:imidazolonepropionase-like amidohydrolase
MKPRLPVLLAMAAAICVMVSFIVAERPHVYALKDVRIVVAPGRVIAKGNVIIRDGLIEAAGANAAIPKDAVEIDGTGKTVYAGLIDAQTTIGLRRATTTAAAAGGRGGNPLAALAAAATPAPTPSGANHPIARIHPELDTRTLLVPFEGEAPPTATGGGRGGGGRGGAAATPTATPASDSERYRGIGFTTVLVEPDSGIIRGESAIINLRDGAPVTALVVRDHVFQHIAIASGGGFGGGGGGYPSSLMGIIASVRQAMIDAQRYVTWKQRYTANPTGMKRPEDSPSFEALAPVVSGDKQVVFDTEAGEDILAADRIAKEFKLKAMMGADSNTYEMIDRIKATGRSLILSAAMPDAPRVTDADDAAETDTLELRRFVNAPSTAKKLLDAKIPFVLSSRNVRTPADFPRNVKRMIDAGLPADEALAKLTTEPAKWLGIDKQMGTVEAGKVANIIVTDGDLFGANTHVVRVFVDGYEYIVPVPPAGRGGQGGRGGNTPPAEANESHIGNIGGGK